MIAELRKTSFRVSQAVLSEIREKRSPRGGRLVGSPAPAIAPLCSADGMFSAEGWQWQTR